MSTLSRFQVYVCLAVISYACYMSQPAMAEQVWAGSEVTAKLSVSDQMTADSTTILGDAVDLYTGSLSFYQTDISIPGNFSIPVSLGRRFHGADYFQRAGIEFGDWGLNIPSITYIVAGNRAWSSDRCTNPSDPGPVSSNFGTVFEPHEYWNGINLNLENGQSKKLLINRSSSYVAITGSKLFTKDNWVVTCISSIGSGLGEGFIVHSPNGLKYTFSKLTYMTATPLIKESKPLERKVARMLVTKITDQWGNYVNYNYSGNNLTSISSSDNRSISIAYNSSNKIRSASANGKTWSYSYQNDSYGKPYLTKVTLPDGRYWTFNLYQLGTTQVMSNFVSVSNEPPHQVAAKESGDRAYATGSIIHPNGLKGSFVVRERSHGRVYMPVVWSDTFPSYRLSDTYFDSLAIEKKTLTGPGLSVLTWNYYYSENDGSWAGSEPANLYKSLRVDAPDGSKTRYHFHRTFDWKEGLIAKTEVLNSSGTVIQTIAKNYIKGHFVGFGNSPDPLSNYESDSNSPYLTNQTVSVSGNTYATDYYDFDGYGRATRMIEKASYSSITKTTNLVFEDHVSDWVLGLPKQTTINGKVAEKLYFCSSNTTTCRKYAPYRGDQFGSKIVDFTYYPDGTYKTINDGLGNATTFGTFKRGLPQSVTVPDSTTQMTAIINNDGAIQQIKDHNSNATNYFYDNAGRLIKTVLPTEAGVHYWLNTDIDYIKVSGSDGVSGGDLVSGQWKQVITQGSNRLTRYYDALMRNVLTKEEDLVTGKVRYQKRRFDAYNRNTFTSLISDTAGEIRGITTQYDALGRVSRKITPAGTTNYSYHTYNRTKEVNPRGQITYYYYQAYGSPSKENIVRINSPEGVTTNIGRDVFGKKTSVRQRGLYSSETIDLTRRYYYDSREKLCRIYNPETGYTALHYDDAGRLKWQLIGASTNYCNSSSIPSNATQFTYDGRGLLKAINYPSGTYDVSFTYDNNGNMKTANRASKNWSYQYNSLNKIKKETLSLDGRTYSLVYGFDGRGSLNDITYPTGRKIDYLPNAFGQPTRAGKYIKNVQYHPSGLISQFTYGNNKVYTLSENSRDMPETIAVAGVASLTYQYDANNNIRSITDNLIAGESKSMTYDGLDRLKTVSGPWGNANYSYDPLGNIRTKTIGNKSYTYNYDYLRNLLSSVSGSKVYSFEYDTQGNVLNNGHDAFIYDKANHMLSVNGGSTSSNEYDAHKRRVWINREGSKTYQVYSQSGAFMHKNAASTNKKEDYIYLGRQQVAKVEGLPGAQAPVAPTYVEAPFLNTTGSFSISWPSSGGTSSYRLQQQKNSGSWVTVYTGSGQTASRSGLTDGEYRFRVAACSSAGCSQYKDSVPVLVDVPEPKPSTPAGLSSPSSDSDGKFSVTWNSTYNTTRYELYRRIGASGSWSRVHNNSTRSYSENYPYSATLYYKVRACNGVGCSAFSGLKSTQVSIYTPPPPPPPPGNCIPGEICNIEQ